MARTWIIDIRGIAKKVKNASLPAANQIKDCGATRECLNCHYLIDNSDVSHDWPGLPAGVKFDPSDLELLENLAAKCGVGPLKPHIFVDEFIQTLESDEGICYTHPENLPGAKKDGSSVHFFHRIKNAYASGQRKRRKIDNEDCMKVHIRWHKTGKTKCVMENGVCKGYKKIMVLYATPKKESKPEKCNWVMHQYHLGTDEDEREGEYVVSKIFYQQPKEIDKNENSLEIEESDMVTLPVIPRTPKTNTPDPPRLEKTLSSGCGLDNLMPSPVQEAADLKAPCHPSCVFQLKDEMECAISLSGDAEAVLSSVNSLFCYEILDDFATFSESGPNNVVSTQEGSKTSDAPQRVNDTSNAICGLDDIELDTPPDFHLSDLQFASQDSVFDWLDRL